MTKALIYARVSTIMQDEKDSLTFQKKKCLDFCEMKSFEVYKIIEDVESGANDDRIGFMDLLKEIDMKTFDVLVVFESSRVSRRTITMLNFVLRLEQHGIKFISISQPELDTTTPTGMLFFQIQSSLGEYERKQISSRTKSSKFQRAKDGLWQGGTLPIGYKKDGKDIIVDDNEANIVRAMFYHYLSTQSIRETAKAFKRKDASMKWILENDFYIGKLSYGKKEKNINTGKVRINDTFSVFEGKHPAIIEEELFDKVQALLKIKKRSPRVEGKLLFTGLLQCDCGGRMYKKTFNSRGYYRTYYCCDVCKKSLISHRVEEEVINQLLELEELKELDYSESDIILEQKLETKISLLENLEKDKKKQLELYQKDYITIEELDSFMSKYTNDKRGLEKEIKSLKDLIEECNSSEFSNSHLEELKEVIANMENQDRNDLHEIFKLFIKKIEVIQKRPLIVKFFIK